MLIEPSNQVVASGKLELNIGLDRLILHPERFKCDTTICRTSDLKKVDKWLYDAFLDKKDDKI